MGGALTRRMAQASAAAATDPNFSSVVLLMGFNGVDAATTTADEGPLAKGNASVNAQAQLDTAQFKFGSASALFDGAADAFYFADSADFEFAAGNFTIEFWLRPNSVTGTHFLTGKGGTAGQQCWLLQTSGTALQWLVSTNSGVTLNVTDINAAAAIPSTGAWYHVCIDFDGSKYRLYVGGVMVGSFSTPRTLFNGTNVLAIGNLGNFSATGLDGWIDEYRLTKGVARYASDLGFTVPTAAFPRA